MKNKRMSAWMLLFVLCIAVCGCQGPEAKLETVNSYNLYQPIPLSSQGRGQVYQLVSFFTATNRQIDLKYIEKIARLYIAESKIEGINSDVAFCQMAHETNYLRFGNDVKADQNNFCGLGATGGVPGHSFPKAKIGVRAHIQHIKAYANARPLKRALVDPRFEKVKRGRCPYLDCLTGKWATDRQYSKKIRRKLVLLESYL